MGYAQEDDGHNYQDSFLKSFLNVKNIAILGLSSDKTKPSYEIAEYLLAHGYTIFPIHPKAKEILGLKVYAHIHELPCCVDILNVFRKSEAIFDIAQEAIESGKVKSIWVQLGIQNTQALMLCKKAHMPYVEDRCILLEHKRLCL